MKVLWLLIAQATALHLLAIGEGNVTLTNTLFTGFGIEPCLISNNLQWPLQPLPSVKTGEVELTMLPGIELNDIGAITLQTILKSVINGCAKNSAPLLCEPDPSREVNAVVISLTIESLKFIESMSSCWLFCANTQVDAIKTRLHWLNEVSKNNTIIVVPVARIDGDSTKLLAQIAKFGGKPVPFVLNSNDNFKQIQDVIYSVPDSKWLSKLRVAIIVVLVTLAIIVLISMQSTDITPIEATSVELPHTHFIPVPLLDLEQQLLKAQQQVPTEIWQLFYRQLDCLISGNAAIVVSRLQEGLNTGVYDSKGANDFLMALCELLTAAEYSPLSKIQLNYALNGKFMFSLPTLLDWTKHCPDTMGSFFQVYNPYGDIKHTPEVAQKGLLIFTRGFSSTDCTGYFWEEKFDYLLLNILATLQRWFKLQKLRSVQKAGVAPQSMSNLGYSKGRASIWGAEQVLPEEGVRRTVALAKRKALEDFIVEQGFWKTLPKQITITEPVFNNVILIWKEPAKPDIQPGEQLAHGVFNLRCYENIPFADIDTLLPIQSVLLRPIHRFIFILQALSALWLVLASMEVTHVVTAGWLLFFFGLLLAVGQQVYALLYTLQFYKQDYNNRLQTWLTGHRVASGPSVVTNLVADVKDQETKEALLGYFMLLKQPGPIGVRELDAQCEEFLFQHFGVHIDFDVHGVLPALCALRLVEVSNGQCAVAQSPAEYLERFPIAKSLTQLLRKA